MPSPGPISSTTSSGSSSASVPMTSSRFLSTRKCWPSRLFASTLILVNAAAPRRRSQREHGGRVEVDLGGQLGRVGAPQLGEQGQRVQDVGGLVPFSAPRLRREVWAVGLGEQPLAGHEPRG